MSIAGRLAAFGAALVVAFAGAFFGARALVPASVAESWQASAADHGEDEVPAAPGETTTPMTLPIAPDEAAHLHGYTVTVDGELVPGMPSTLTVTIKNDEADDTTLLRTDAALSAADGPGDARIADLAVLRGIDLAAVPVEYQPPNPTAGAPPHPEATFTVTPPATGEYRLLVSFWTTVDDEPKQHVAQLLMSAADQSAPRDNIDETEPGEHA